MAHAFVHATPETFDALTTTADGGLVVAYFWGPDCPNCDVFAEDAPGLLEGLPPDVRLVKVNAYEHTQLATRFGLFGVPAFVLFRRGKVLGMMRQYNGREFWKTVVEEQAVGPVP